MSREIFNGRIIARIERGFTLVEVLLAIGIALVLLVAATPLYTNLLISSQLNEHTSQIVQTLRIAREQSVARLNNAEHGLKIESDRYILYQGASYTLRNSAYDREIVLDSGVILSWSLVGTGADGDITFSRGLGVPNSTGTITITHDTSGTRSIFINSLGIVEKN